MFHLIPNIPKLFVFISRRFGTKAMDKPSVLVTRCDFAPEILEELKSKYFFQFHFSMVIS